MCGIAGSFMDSNFSVSTALDRLRHRGPDGGGQRTHEGVTHGHRRLALVDLSSSSSQPFVCRKGCLSFVGEIWNYRELRAELSALGQEFHTSGDTEVLAVALHVWGENALHRLDGMFAFAWSSPELRILARDAYGKIPLYVAKRGAGVCWASERKAFTGEILESIEALPPGCVMDLHSNHVHEWYHLPPRNEVHAGTECGREILEKAVAKRLHADAPVCVLISGGLDSAGVLCAASWLRKDVVAYTAFSDEKSADLKAARRLCAELNVELREVCVPFPTTEDLRAAVWAIEIPTKTQVEIAVLCLPLAKRIAADGFKACLSGEAADELFGGYGSMCIKAGGLTDGGWRDLRVAQLEKMGRGNFVRCNKAFMAHGVECRLPFADRAMVEWSLSLSKSECPPAKKLLKRSLLGLVPEWVVKRPKETFQGGAGVNDWCESLFQNPRAAYNRMAAELFDGVPST